MRIKVIVLLILGILFDVLTGYAVIRNSQFASQIIISWGFIGIGLTLLGIGFYLVGQGNETPKLSQ